MIYNTEYHGASDTAAQQATIDWRGNCNGRIHHTNTWASKPSEQYTDGSWKAPGMGYGYGTIDGELAGQCCGRERGPMAGDLKLNGLCPAGLCCVGLVGRGWLG
jgi:hypothetical protein